MEVISREEARRLGLKRYFTGEPCKRGHIVERLVSSRGCVKCAQKLKKEWYSKNPGAMAEEKRKAVQKNPEKYKSIMRRWREKNREKDAENSRNYYYQNKESRLQYQKAWVKRNPDKVRMHSRLAAAKRRAADGAHTVDDIKRLLTEQKHKCAACKADIRETGYHVDHIVPLARGGTNWPENLQILCPFCNLSKGAKDPYEWAQENGRLL